MKKVVCFGEVLWDIFPNYKKIGGAPLNVALRLKSFGNDVHMISRIGGDHNGDEIIQYLVENKLDISTIQIDSSFKTGAVHVTLDSEGSASYEIEYPVAWDKIALNEESLSHVKTSDAFIFGSLACRDAVSRKSLLTCLEHATFKVFDVNLRPPHYSMPLLIELMKKADMIKCNEDELQEVCRTCGFISKSMQEQVQFLATKTSTNSICVTLGGDGALLFLEGKFYSNDGHFIEVADTVGAGDSFLAALVSKLLEEASYQDALNFATAVGAMVASKSGANPILDDLQISNFMKNEKN